MKLKWGVLLTGESMLLFPPLHRPVNRPVTRDRGTLTAPKIVRWELVASSKETAFLTIVYIPDSTHLTFSLAAPGQGEVV
jgi:hypothetical protein